MSRTARVKSSTGIYHVFIRGINRQTIFNDEEDCGKFLEVVEECKKISGFELYGYCLMGNHLHLLIKEGAEGLDTIFKRIGTRYVYWYNDKYGRSGHLFQDRYKSEPVEDDGYFMTVLRYIHQNPLKAGLCNALRDYQWSSYREYAEGRGIIDREAVYRIIEEERFADFMSQATDDTILDLEEPKKRLRDEELIEKIERELCIKAAMIQREAKVKRDELLRAILRFEGVTTRQISRVTGVPINMIWKLR